MCEVNSPRITLRDWWYWRTMMILSVDLKHYFSSDIPFNRSILWSFLWCVSILPFCHSIITHFPSQYHFHQKNTESVISSPGWTSSAAKRQGQTFTTFLSLQFGRRWSSLEKILQNYHHSQPHQSSTEEHVTVYVCCQTGPATLVA